MSDAASSLSARVRLGLALGIGGAVLSVFPMTALLEESTGLAALFALRGRMPPPEEVVIVGVSRDAAARVGQSSELDTWPRDLHGALVERLAAAGATAIAFDLIFNEPREVTGDHAFAEALARAGIVLLAERTVSESLDLGVGAAALIERRVPPLPELKTSALGTAPFVLPTVPVSLRQFWAFGRAADDMPSLPVVAVQAHLLSHYEELLDLLEGVSPGVTTELPRTRADVEASKALEVVVRSLRGLFQRHTALAGDARKRLRASNAPPESEAALQVLLDLYSGGSSRYLNFYGPARSVATLRYDQALLGDELPDVAGKTVFVGLSEPRQSEQQDDFVSVFSEHNGNNLSGVEVGATAFANLLERRSIEHLPVGLQALWVLAFGLGIGALLAGRSTFAAGGVAAAAGLAYLGAAYWQFASYANCLPLVVPLAAQIPVGFVAVVRHNYRELALQRERVRTALGYYVPRALAERLAKETLSTTAERRLVQGTCLVTDAEHYTTVSEALSPEQLVVLMNDYYRTLFGVVERYGGEISDTAGDSMVAVWASAKPNVEMRRRATEAAAALLVAVDEFNAGRSAMQLPTRIGLESGELLLGNVGSERRFEYRAIGDIVNTASRIQGLNRLLGTRVLISAATLDGVDLGARDLGAFLLKGKRMPVRVLEPLDAARCRLDDPGLEAFGRALRCVREGAWESAESQFAALAARFPEDGPTRYYLGLSRMPPADWNGVASVDAK